MKVEVLLTIQGRQVAVPVACPFCPTDPPAPDPQLVEADHFHCPQCKRIFVAYNVTDYLDAITASRPALLVGELLRPLIDR